MTVTRAYKVRKGCVGVIAVEFAMVLLVFFTFMLIVSELYRVSLIDQTLARATHRGALAAGRNPADCETAAQEALAEDRVALWLFDANGDDVIGFHAGTNPDGTPNQEVGLEIASYDGELADGVVFNMPGCVGSWIEVHAAVPVRPLFRRGRTLMREYRGWSVRQ